MIIAQENISPMMRGQRTLFRCPLCSATNTVFVTAEQLCSACKQSVPNIFKLMKEHDYRKDYYMGVIAILSVVK